MMMMMMMMMAMTMTMATTKKEEEEDLFSQFLDQDNVRRHNAYFQYGPQPYIPRLVLYLLCSQDSFPLT